MAIDILMPALSPTMEKGTLARWLVKEGDSVAPGDIIAEIETDKATMEVEASDEGRVGRLLVAEGTEDIPVGARIAVLLEEGEDESALEGVEAAPPPAAPSAPAPTKATEKPAEKAPGPAAEKTPAAPAPAAAPAVAPKERAQRIFASPLARRLAEKRGVDLASIKGSGPHGRIVKADVEAAARAPAARPAAAAAPAAAPIIEAPEFTPPADVPYEEIKLSGMRKVIARRMAQSKSHVPHFYLTIDTALDRLLAERARLNARLADEGVRLSVNDFLIRAAALALKKVPAANAMYAGDRAYRFTRQDISVAVAVEGGLVTPVIRDAAAKGLAEISREMKALAEKARAGKLMPEEYQGGTFSISNLGMYGIREFAAVINPPQGAILAVGAGEKRPVVVDDAIAIRTMMTVTLAVDHRVLDGAIGAEFLAAFRGFVEDPITMLL
ncbi:MAG: pyruvate dehydrogenase complex dihydrolipoamide acetyltransferase [Rhodothalassiaceae bacterium]